MPQLSTGSGLLRGLLGGTSGPAIQQQPVNGVQVINVGSTALTTNTQSPTLPLIPNYNGLPLAALHFQVIRSDTTGNTTAPANVQVVETTVKELSLRSLYKSIPLVDIRGDFLSFTRWQHLKNPNGYYVASSSPSDTAVATTNTSTWNFDLYYSVPAQYFPLVPSLTLNTLASTATTGNAMTSSVTVFTITADYIPQPGLMQGTRLVNSTIQDSTTGNFQAGPFVDKGVTIVQQAYDFGIDTNLNTSNTFNFSIGTNQILLNAGYQTIINKENTLFPSATHITGFFPLFTSPLFSDPTLVNTINVSSAPYINSSSGPNSFTNQLLAYWEEVIPR